MRRLLLMVAALVVASCGGTEVVERTPSEAMTDVSAALLAADSFRFQVAYDGDPITVLTGLTLDRVDGSFEAPLRSKADVRVKTLGLTAVLEVITDGDDAWQKVPFADDFEPMGSDGLITGSDVFSEDGLGALLREDLTDLAYGDDAELEEFPGETFATVTGAVAGDRLPIVTLGYLQGETADVTIFIVGDEIRRLVVFETDAESPRTWTIDLWAYGQPVDITVP